MRLKKSLFKHLRHLMMLFIFCPSFQLHSLSEAKADSEELEKSVKILQGKLDKQKQLTKEYEMALKSHRPPVGGATIVGGGNGMGQPLVDSKVVSKLHTQKFPVIMTTSVSRVVSL